MTVTPTRRDVSIARSLPHFFSIIHFRGTFFSRSSTPLAVERPTDKLVTRKHFITPITPSAQKNENEQTGKYTKLIICIEFAIHPTKTHTNRQTSDAFPNVPTQSPACTRTHSGPETPQHPPLHLTRAPQRNVALAALTHTTFRGPETSISSPQLP